MSNPELKFIENIDPQGCFSAGLEALTGVSQQKINERLAQADLHSDRGTDLVGADVLNKVLAEDLPDEVSLEGLFEAYDPFEDDPSTHSAFDKSEEAVNARAERILKVLSEPKNSGILLGYPCKRAEGQRPFAHFVAIASGEDDKKIAVMDPSELMIVEDELVPSSDVDDPNEYERIGGLSQLEVDELKGFLVPEMDNNEFLYIPISGYSVGTT